MPSLQEHLSTTSIKDALYNARIANLYYIEWFNDFLTIEYFAEYYNITTSYALAVIELGRQYNHGRI
jgi:hypothetical protein